MRKHHLTLGIVLAFAMLPTAAIASHSPTDDPPTDFATGSGFVQTPVESLDFSLTASSGPLGENPTGTFGFFVVDTGRNSFGRVTCLHVDGNTATAIGVVEGGTNAPVGTEFAFTVIDDGFFPPADALAGPIPSPVGRGCEDPVIGASGVLGTVVVHDGQPVGPTRGDYKNASHYCKALSDFLGDAEFSQRHKNHGKCVSANQ